MVRRISKLTWFYAAALVAFAVSCSSLGESVAANTTIRLDGVGLEDPARQGLAVVKELLGAAVGAPPNGGGDISITLRLSLDNKNSFTLNLTKVTYAFLVDGKIVGTGSKEGKGAVMTFEPGEGKIVELLVRIFTRELVAHALNGLAKKEAALAVKGELTFETVLGEITVPYNAEKKM